MLLGATMEVADDLAQEAFLVFLRRGSELTDEASAAAFLRRSAFNLLRDSRRNEAKRLGILREEAAEVIWKKYRLDEKPDVYREALTECEAHLTDRMQKTVDLFYRRGMSGPEVAKARGLSESDVWSTLHRARERLRSCINRKLSHEA